MNAYAGTVVSSRIRLARNVKGKKFPNRFDDPAEAKSLANLVYDSLTFLKEEDLNLYYLDSIDYSLIERFKENYIISDTLLDHADIASVITDPQGEISIMINEEDNIREQYMGRGFVIRKLFERAMDIDRNYIGKKIAYSRDERFGFLTACPTNLGSGLRASVMLFLPGIVKTGAYREIIERRLPQGFTIRGINGEGSVGEGYLYQISNEVTLGIKEEDVISRLEDFVQYISEFEAQKRYELKDKNVLAFRDCCGRAYGILSNAEILRYDEFLKLISEIKLGVILGFYTVRGSETADEGLELIEDLTVAMRESNLSAWESGDDFDEGEDDEEPERDEAHVKDVYRAECVRRFMEKYVCKVKIKGGER